MNYLKYVNPLMGTNSVKTYSNGNLSPITALPFGANHFTLETRPNSDFLFFNPNDHQTTGIRLTHQLSPWLGDYGALTMLPTSEEKVDFTTTRASGYIKEKAIFSPCLLRCGFLRYQTEMSLVPTMHGAKGTIKYGDTAENKRLFIDCANGTAQIDIDAQNGIIKGFVSNHILPHVLPKNFKEFFVIKFNAPISVANTIAEVSGEEQTASTSYKGENLKLSLCFDTENNEISYSIATSFIGFEQLFINFDAEIGEKSEAELLKQAEDIWSQKLSKIDIQTDDEAQKQTFYTCLYRTYLFPHTFHEINAAGDKIHYSPVTGETEYGPLYTDMGFWDTYRTSMPLLTILEPDLFADICKGLVNFYKESGWLLRFSAPGPISCMPGTAVDMIFADAVKKEILPENSIIPLMLEGMIKHANQPCEISKLGGRDGILDYKKLGYVPLNYRESVNKTLDYAYGDYCISVIAEALNKPEVAKEYKKRALNYKNLFDRKTNLLKARDIDGNFRPDFREFEWSFDYTEGSAWQNSFSVFHDMAGHAELMGGTDQMVKMIDKIFALPPIFEVGYRGKEIHEMTEMASVDFGQCALSNQPSFHVPYIYSYMGAPDSTCYQVRRAVRELFNPTENGYPGDEDTGSMSAWYIFSSLGFYPVTPGTAEYVLASPSVKSAVIHTGYGTKFKVETRDFSQDNLYAKSVNLDENELDQTFITHKDIKKGKTLTFNLTNEKTNKKYKNTPFSLSK